MDIFSDPLYKGTIIRKFEEIDYKDGLILIEYIINNYNYYDEDLLKEIIVSLAKNKKKYPYKIYEYIVKNTCINHDTPIIHKYYGGDSLIHFSAKYENINLLNYLIKNGADINLQNSVGDTSLISSYISSHATLKTIKLLLYNGADPNIQNIDGNSILMLSLIWSSLTSLNEQIIFLLRNGSDIDLKHNFGIHATTLKYSYVDKVSSKNEIIKLLLENGADINLKNIEGKTALDLAQTNECKDLIKSYIN